MKDISGRDGIAEENQRGLEMAIEELRELLDGRLRATAADEGIPVAWTNTLFTPRQDTAVWLRPHLLMGEERLRAVVGTGSVVQGIYQVDVLVPSGAGCDAFVRAMRLLREWYPKQCQIRGESVRAVMLRHSAGRTTMEPPYCKRRLDIYFAALLAV